jgi:hypothetical protein
MNRPTLSVNAKPETQKKKWLKRMGIWGFMFFLIKGLAWIGVAIWGWWMAS